jgi:hypothetical protein
MNTRLISVFRLLEKRSWLEKLSSTGVGSRIAGALSWTALATVR